MLATELRFYAPASIDEAIELLEANPEAKLLAGGMSLVPMMNLGLARPAGIVSLNRVAGLDDVEEEPGTLSIGAMSRHVRIESDPLIGKLCPPLREAAALIGDVQVRNRGTIGGSVAHADPAADYLPVLVALGASLTLAGPGGERAVSARDFFAGALQTALTASEILVRITVPKLEPGAGSSYLRLGQVEGSFAIVSAACVLSRSRRAVAVGGARSTPVELLVPPDLEDDTVGVLDTIQQAARDACAGALDDLSASAEYRQELAGVYARRAVAAALASRSTSDE